MKKIKLIYIVFIQASFLPMVQGMSETPNEMLLRGARFGDTGVKTMQMALKQSADVNFTDEDGNTALMILAKSTPFYGKAAQAVKVLMDAGANLYVKNKNGENLIDLAKKGNKDILDQIFLYFISLATPKLVQDLYPIIGEYAFEEQVFDPANRPSFQASKISEEDKDIMMSNFISQIEERAGTLKSKK